MLVKQNGCYFQDHRRESVYSQNDALCFIIDCKCFALCCVQYNINSVWILHENLGGVFNQHKWAALTEHPRDQRLELYCTFIKLKF